MKYSRLSVLIFSFLVCSVCAKEPKIKMDVLESLTGYKIFDIEKIHYTYDQTGNITHATIIPTADTLLKVDSAKVAISDTWEVSYMGIHGSGYMPTNLDGERAQKLVYQCYTPTDVADKLFV